MKRLDLKLRELINTPSDINEHLQVIKEYSEKCNNIVELGVRSPVSTFALLAGRPKKLTSVDILHPSYFQNGQSELDLVYSLAKEEGIDFDFVQSDSITHKIQDCDLLLIDTWHSYRQLIAELSTHQSNINKYIILHDTSSFEAHDESNWASSPEPVLEGTMKTGLWTAVLDFIATYKNWTIHERYTHNNGLTILKRI